MNTKTRLIYICYLQETHFRLKVRGWKKLSHVNGNQKKLGVAIHILDKVNFKAKVLQETKKDITY